MSARSSRRLVAAALLVVFALPVPGAQAAPAGPLEDLDCVLALSLEKLLTSLQISDQLCEQIRQERPTEGPRDGVGIDPNGKPPKDK